MKTTVEENTFTFSNYTEAVVDRSDLPDNTGDSRPKANPLWMKHNRPTLQLPETESPRFLQPQRLSSGMMNNVDLIDHAFSTPTSGTPLTSGFYSSGSETPLLGLAGLSSVNDRDTHLDSVCQIFDKISLERRHEKVSQTPPPEFQGKGQGIHKRVSFDVQSILSPLSAKPFDHRRTEHREFVSNRPSIWETSLDNVNEKVRPQGEQEYILNHEYRTALNQRIPAGPPSRHSAGKGSPYLTSPHSATVPYFGRSFQSALRPLSQFPQKQIHPDILISAPASTRTKPIEQQSQHDLLDHDRRVRSSLSDDASSFLTIENHFSEGQISSPLLAHDHQENIGRRDNRGHGVPRGSPKPSTPLTCFACRGVGHKATQCPTHPRPVVATSSTDVIVNCAIHGKPRTSKNMFFNNELGLWQCFSETECKSMVN